MNNLPPNQFNPEQIGGGDATRESFLETLEDSKNRFANEIKGLLEHTDFISVQKIFEARLSKVRSLHEFVERLSQDPARAPSEADEARLAEFESSFKVFGINVNSLNDVNLFEEQVEQVLQLLSLSIDLQQASKYPSLDVGIESIGNREKAIRNILGKFHELETQGNQLAHQAALYIEEHSLQNHELLSTAKQYVLEVLIPTYVKEHERGLGASKLQEHITSVMRLSIAYLNEKPLHA